MDVKSVTSVLTSEVYGVSNESKINLYTGIVRCTDVVLLHPASCQSVAILVDVLSLSIRLSCRVNLTPASSRISYTTCCTGSVHATTGSTGSSTSIGIPHPRNAGRRGPFQHSLLPV